MWKLNHQGRGSYLNQKNTQMRDLYIYIKTKILQQHLLHSTKKPEPSEPSRKSIWNKKHKRTNLPKKGGRTWWFQRNIKKFKIFFFEFSKNKRGTYLTNFAAVTIDDGHKTKLDSSLVLALSLSYWPINQMSESISPTHRNLILTSIALQLMSLVVSRPYLVLMKCWWK